jgi:hypothetical protein
MNVCRRRQRPLGRQIVPITGCSAGREWQSVREAVALRIARAALALFAVALDLSPLNAQTRDDLTPPIARALSEEGLVGATWALVTPGGTTLGAAGLKDASRNAPMAPHDRTGTRYEAWLDAALLAPLGMTRSTFEFVTQAGPDGDASLAMGHFDPATISATVASHVRPASQFTTTAEDMARFARFLMSDGRVEGRVLVDSSLLRAMAMPTTTEAARAGLAAGYALGLTRRDRHGFVGRCHLGNTGTFRAALCLFPDAERAFFISHNTDPENGNFDRVDAMLVRALGVPSPPEQPAQPPGVDPMQWEGLYLVRPSRFAQFAYLDEVMGLTRVRWNGRVLQLLPMQGTARALTPIGGAFFRAADRREATHVLLRSVDDRLIITDGLRTLPTARWDLLALGAALQWCVVLAARGLLPLALWR